MTTKPTKRDLFLRVFAVLCDSEVGDSAMLCDFIAHEIALLDKRAAAPKALTPAQRENVVLKRDAVSFLNSVEYATATEVAKALGVTVQRATALLTALTKTAHVVREVDGKQVRFRVNDAAIEANSEA